MIALKLAKRIWKRFALGLATSVLIRMHWRSHKLRWAETTCRYLCFASVVLVLGTITIFSAEGLSAAQPSKHSKRKTVSRRQSGPVCVAPIREAIHSSVIGFNAHAVTLSWGASVPSPDHAPAEGYCLYRSKTKGDAKLVKDCKDCELLSQKPVSGSMCVDNTVIDGQTYYYAVAGVNAAGMSGPSNEASAFVRASTPTSGPPQGIPSCSDDATGKARAYN